MQKGEKMEIKELISIDELTEKICNAEYAEPDYLDKRRMETHKVCAYSAAEKAAIRNAIIEYMAEKGPSEIAAKIAELEARIFVYEKAIANSNFAAILPGYVSPLDRAKELKEKQAIIEDMEARETFHIKRIEDLEREVSKLTEIREVEK